MFIFSLKLIQQHSRFIIPLCLQQQQSQIDSLQSKNPKSFTIPLYFHSSLRIFDNCIFYRHYFLCLMSSNPYLSILGHKQSWSQVETSQQNSMIISEYVKDVDIYLLFYNFGFDSLKSSIGQQFMCETSQGNSQELKILHISLHQQAQLSSFRHIYDENAIFPYQSSCFSGLFNIMSYSKLNDPKVISLKDNQLYPINISDFKIFQHLLFQSDCHQQVISTKNNQNILSNTFYFLTLEQKGFQSQNNLFEENNCQGCFTMFNPYKNQPLHILKKVNHALRKSSIFALKPFWNGQFREYLLELIKNSEIYLFDAYQLLFNFLKINQFKMLCLQSYLQENLYQKIFPGSSLIFTALQKILQVSSLSNQKQKLQEMINNKRKESQLYQMSMNQINQFFQKQFRSYFKLEKQSQVQKSFFQQLKQFLNITTNCNKKAANKFNKFIKQMEQELNKYLSYLRNTFQKMFADEIAFCIQSLIHQNLELYKSKVQEQKQNFKNDFKSVQNFKITQSKCMGCSRVFIINQRIYDPTVTSVPVKHFPTIHKLKDYQVEFKDNICAMLNSGGGVILFDCHEINQDIYARGQILTEKQKEQIQQRVTSYFRWFYPKPEINTNIKISFIPITSKRTQMQQDEIKKQYQVGVYVTRLRIAPSQSSKLYFWFHSKRQNPYEDRQEISLKFFCMLDNKNNPKLVNLRQARRLMKRRFKNSLNQSVISDEFMIRKPVNIFGHECQNPQMGQQVTKKQNKYQIISQPQQILNDKKNYNTVTTLQSKFNYVTLLIAKKQDLPRLKQKLYEAKIECQIQVRFTKYNLKPANNSAVLYHDKSFQIVHNLVTHDPRFRFSNGKGFMAINVTKYLRFQNRNQRNKIDNSIMVKLEEWLKKQFDNEKITFYEYNVDNKKKEYYLQSTSKLSLLFMYFMINHYAQKVTFKNPFNLEKYSMQQKAGQLKKINIFHSDQQDKSANFFKNKQRQQSYKYLGQ